MAFIMPLIESFGGEMTRADHRWLALILIIAAFIRLSFILVADPAPNLSGGDVGWYLDKGRLLVANKLDHPVQTGPTFLVYVGVVQNLIPDPLVAMRDSLPFWSPHPTPTLASQSRTVTTLRLLNLLWHSILIVAVYSLGKRYFSSGTARLAALVTAISPAFVIEASLPLTESLFFALIFGALAIYAQNQDRPSARALIGVGVLIGLATLTRVVTLLFPVVIVVHLVWLHGWRQGGRWALILAAAFCLTLSSWTVYNLYRWNRFIIGGEGLTAFAWMGVTGVTDPYAIDQQIGEAAHTEQRDQAFIEGFLGTLFKDLPGWIRMRLSNLFDAALQPHNTVYFPGESLKALASEWLRTDRSIGGLISLSEGDAFWPKLALYGFHLWAWGAGLLGLIILPLRRTLRPRLPLYGFIVYILAVHTVILAIPRYLFPIEPALYLFGAGFTAALWQRREKTQSHKNIRETA